MHSLTRYAAVTAPFLLATCGLSVLGLAVGADLFASPSRTGKFEVQLATQNESPGIERPTSELLGAKATAVAAGNTKVTETSDWVEVVDAVNMRGGSSSANDVIKVQLAGTKLRVASRDGKWVEVVEPDTGSTGWVFETFVKSIEPASRRADAAETAVR